MAADDVFGGLAGGFKGLQDFLLLKRGMTVQDEERRREQQLHDLRMQVQELQRQALQRNLDRAPVAEAAEDLNRRLQLMGPEATLNDPAGVAAAERAGIPLERKQPALPEFFSSGEQFPGRPPLTAGTQAQLSNAEAGIFGRTGVVKPPEVRQKEVARDLAIQQAQTVQNFLTGMTGQKGSGKFNSDDPMTRVFFRLGLDMNPNEIFGPMRETPEEAADKAKKVAEARQPIQQQLIDYAMKGRANLAGDPYMNTLLQGIGPILALMSMGGEASEEQLAQALAGLSALAQQLQNVHPRGQGAIVPAEGGDVAPPSPDEVINDAVERFGSLDAAIIQLRQPKMQQGLRDDGLDPNKVLARALARKAAEGRQ